MANYAAENVMKEMQDIIFAYGMALKIDAGWCNKADFLGQSDEYSFAFRKNTVLYKRREAKIITTLVSLFTSNYIIGMHLKLISCMLTMLLNYKVGETSFPKLI